MSHFEDLWNEAEELSLKHNDNRQTLDICKSINENIKNLAFLDDKVERHVVFGSILYEMCSLSRVMDVNSYSALKLILEKIKNESKNV